MLENSTRAGSYEFQHWKGQQKWCFIFSTSLHCSVVKVALSVRNVYSEKLCFFDLREWTFQNIFTNSNKIGTEISDFWSIHEGVSSFDSNLQHRFFPEATHVQTFKHCFLTAPSVRTKLQKKKIKQRENNAQSAYASNWFKKRITLW